MSLTVTTETGQKPGNLMPSSYDVIVVGLGAIGSASLYALARRGVCVFGLEKQAVSPHPHGSSHGQTRILRVAYQEGAHYIPLIRRSIELWRELEKASNTELFQQSGIVYFGPEDAPLISDTIAAARAHNVRLESAANDLYSDVFANIPASWLAIAESEGGYLYLEKSIETLLASACQNRASVKFNTDVTSYAKKGSQIEVQWANGMARADAVIVCPGPWAADQFSFLDKVLKVESRSVHWYTDDTGHYSESAQFRPFAVQPDNDNLFYGLPRIDARGVKLGNHGRKLGTPLRRPQDIDRHIVDVDRRDVAEFARRHLPTLGDHRQSNTCMYTMSPDGNFLIDQHPDIENLFFAAGMSGHGFKFAPVLGEIMADLALGGIARYDLAPFSLQRFES